MLILNFSEMSGILLKVIYQEPSSLFYQINREFHISNLLIMMIS